MSKKTTFIETLIKLNEAPEGYMSTTKVDLKLKSGLTIPKGTKVWCSFPPNSNSIFLINLENGDARISYKKASNYFTGFSAPPSINKLEKMVDSGIATTPLGNRTEPDGHGPNGEPSWLLVLGLI